MNMKSLIISIFATFYLCMYPSFSHAQPVETEYAKTWVNKTGRQLIEALTTSDIEKKYSLLDAMFTESIDTKYMARFVIGKYWKSMNKTQQNEYIGLFNRYAQNIYKNYPLDFDLEGLDFEITSVQQAQKFTNVICSIDLPEQYANDNFKTIKANFKLTQDGEKVKIVDLTLGESSLLVAYRSKFYGMITALDEDMSWFLEDFNDMVVSAEKTIEEKAKYY